MPVNLKQPNFGISEAFDKFAKEIKDIVAATDTSVPPNAIRKPWKAQKESFFNPISIDGDRWNKLYPYRLVVVDAFKGYQVVTGASLGISASATKLSEDRYQISFEPFGGKWEFRLPITPQQLSIVTQFSTQTSATLKGVVEEHNGVKFKIISAAGTFGLWPYKPNKASAPGSTGILGTLFGGTIAATNNLIGQVTRVINTFRGSGHPAGARSAIEPQQSDFGIGSTGYAYAMLLDQFLEQYAEAKKNPKNAGWRLVFDIPKQNQAFIVTPQIFEWSQSAESPNEIRYRMQFKAWRRITLNDVSPTPPPALQPLSANFLQRAITALDEARRTAASALNLIQAVRGDFQGVLNIMRQSMLLLKDLMGVGLSAAELPRQLAKDCKEEITRAILVNRQINLTETKMEEAWRRLWNKSNKNEGASGGSATQSMLGPSSVFAAMTDPSNEIFDNPEEYYSLFASVPLDSIQFTPEQQEQIDQEIQSVQNTSVDQLIQYQEDLMELANQIANLYGAGDAVYSRIYDKPPPLVRLQEMTIDEYAFLSKLYELIQIYQILTATQELDDGRIQSALEYVGSLANESNIPFEAAQSKLIVPVPFGLSIEQIAARYLGNPDRWIEIATLNALKSPYIDENGFEIKMLSNAEGRQFNLPSAQNLYIGQVITIISDNQPRTMRRIINIEKINETNYLITVDGLDNLSIYTTTHNARIKAYLPGTVNSQNQIFIPSDIEAPDDVRSRSIPRFKSDPLVGLSKVDLLLTEDGDLAMDNFKDIKLAGGITNLIQALKLKFATPINSLIKHPDYGSGITPGTSTADFTATEIYNTIVDMIRKDGRFGEVEYLKINLDGPTLSISMSVRIANGNGVLPISFTVR